MSTSTTSLLQKLVLGTATGAFLIAALYSPIASNRSHAQWTVIDPTNLVQNTVSAVADADQLIISKVLNGLAWSVAKMTVQSITRSMVNWINTGFQGSPAFVSDLRENLLYLGDAVADGFINQLDQYVEDNTGFNLRSPFQDQISAQLRQEYYRTTSSWGVSQYYDLYKDSTDPKAFVQQGQFSKGGFNAWFSASQNPANNPFGAYTMAHNQLWAQIDSAAQARRAELDWGRGFLPWRGNCNNQAGNNTNLSRAEGCLFAPNKTPGALVEQALGITVTSPIRQLELADSINEIVAALMGQMVNQVLGGVGLTGLSQPASGGGRSYLDVATDPAQFSESNGSLANGILQNISTEERNVQTFRSNWQRVLDAANNAERRCGAQLSITNAKIRAEEGISQANRALTEIAAQRAKIIAATQSTSANKSIEIATAVTDYTNFVSNSSVPTASQYAEAERQSADTVNQDGDPVSNPSLYTQMTQLSSARSCVVR